MSQWATNMKLKPRFAVLFQRIVGSFLLLLAVSSCVGPAPVDDYNLAAAALQSAKQAGASRFASGFLTKANDYYKQALVEYDNRDYKKAQVLFRQARLFAERAENVSVIKRAQTGEVPE